MNAEIVAGFLVRSNQAIHVLYFVFHIGIIVISEGKSIGYRKYSQNTFGMIVAKGYALNLYVVSLYVEPGGASCANYLACQLKVGFGKIGV
jgi:hypothetical protein